MVVVFASAWEADGRFGIFAPGDLADAALVVEVGRDVRCEVSFEEGLHGGESLGRHVVLMVLIFGWDGGQWNVASGKWKAESGIKVIKELG